MPKPRTVGGDTGKEEIAARLVAASAGHLKVPEAMKIVKMSTPVPRNDSVRRRVLRRARKIEKEAESNPTILAGPVVVEVPGTGSSAPPSSQDTGGISSITGTSGGSGSTSITCSTATVEGIDEVRRNLNQQVLGSGSPKGKNKRRRSSNIVQQNEANKCKKRKIQSKATKVATVDLT